ncbi:MAG: phasin family protein [Holophagales bacterium]|nr:phasin family protein [Holophagales bacterium]
MSNKEQLNERFEQMTSDMRDLGRNVWLAGLGAVGSVDEQSRAMFSKLVARGEKVDGKLGEGMRKPFDEARERFESLGERLEQGVESRMTRTLHLFGVPARGDLEKLIDRVEKLTDRVEGLAR